MMKITPMAIPEILLIQPEVFLDERGFFMEVFQADRFASAGLPSQFVQNNYSGSHQGTLRGLHYQIRHSQGKLVQVVAGEIFEVAVDLRNGSPNFGKWAGRIISSKDHLLVWVPMGFAHGFYILSEWADVTYQTTDFYVPDAERVLLWNDPALNITWPLVDGRPPFLSAKDAKGMRLSEAEVFE
jgi:dTDP-4-dehydrorhamnose 3,5-epimerase